MVVIINDVTVGLYLGLDHGVFLYATLFSVAFKSVFADGDNKNDLVIAQAAPDTIGILFDDGNGSFGGKREQSVGPYLYWLDISDFNSDNRLDLIVCRRSLSLWMHLFEWPSTHFFITR